MPYSDPGDQFGMTSEQRNHLRRRIPLLTYLEKQGWKPAAYSESDEVCGRCPLHFDSRPSFYVNRRKDVFFCHGCGQGGDVIRLAQLLHGLDFRTALATLAQQQDQDQRQLWSAACDFYQAQLRRDCEAQAYLRSRGIAAETADHMRIGYAPGGCLRAYLEELGYSRAAIAESGLTDTQGRDRLRRAITFPLEETANVYGRQIDLTTDRHRFLARSKGGLYGWKQARRCQTVIVVEGLFDLASLWQAGFTNTVALLGSHFTAQQLAQLCDGRLRTVYLCLDNDGNGSGQRAAGLWRRRLEQAGVRVAPVQLPAGYDPNRFFAEGGSAQRFVQFLGGASQ
jgi:DNA primase